MFGDVLDSHMAREFDDIAFERFGVSASRICEIDIDLPDNIAIAAQNTWNIQSDIDLFVPDRQGMEPPQLSSSPADPVPFAVGASKGVCRFFDGEDNRSLLILGTDVPISINTESMIQYACGHTSTSFMC